VPLRVFPSAVHIFDSFEGVYESNDPGSHRRKRGHVRVHANPGARQQERNDVQVFTDILK
jgi:hypothetical protein